MTTAKTFFDPHGDRYHFDFDLCSAKKGFAQVDTRNDASYYGHWASPRKRQFVSFMEGDITVNTYGTDEEFVTAVREFASWADGDFKGIDCMCRDELTQGFEKLGLGDLLH